MAPSRLPVRWFAAAAILTVAAPMAAQTGTLVGVVSDRGGGPLPGATVRVVGSGIGAAAGFDGRVRITGVPAGAVRVAVSFVGYASDTLALGVGAGATIRFDAVLEPVTLRGGPVEVSAQLSSRLVALNRRRASATLIDVVTADQIQAFPDATAAEAIGRLPGVGLERDGAEGLKARLRGLDPTFTAVTLDGHRVPATDPRDRSVDLSFVPADLLESIDVVKAVTPDRDADSIGGAVDLVVSRAPRERRAEVRVEGGYASLRDAYGDGRLSARLSDRLWDGRVGAVLTADVESADRSYDAYTDDLGDGPAAVRESASIEVSTERHRRRGGGVALDYDAGGGGRVELRGVYVWTSRDQSLQRTRYRVARGELERALRTRDVAIAVTALSLRAERHLGDIRVAYGGSASRAVNRRPDGYEAVFRQPLLSVPGGGSPVSLDDLVVATELRPGDTALASWHRGRRDSEDRDLTAHVEAAVPFRVGRGTAEVRGGVKLRDKLREQDGTRHEVLGGRVPGLDIPTLADVGLAEGLPFVGDRVAIGPFLAPGPGLSALDGRFGLGAPLDATALGAIDCAYADAFVVNPFYDRNDFEASETVAAAFALVDVAAGPLRVIGGVRAEHTRTAYTGRTGGLQPGLVAQLRSDPAAAVRDTSGGSAYGHLFPQAVARLRVGGLDIRAAATRTLARPGFSDFVVRENVDDRRRIVERGNPAVDPMTAWNLELSVAHVGPAGLVAGGAFAKWLDDYIYGTTSRLEAGPLAGYRVVETVNGGRARVLGVEGEAHVHFSLLPGPLSGLVASANVTVATSTAGAPVQVPTAIDVSGAVRTRTETREGPLPGLTPYLANVTLGYERGGYRGSLTLSHRGATRVLVPPPTFDARLDGSGTLVVTEATAVGVTTRPLTRLDVQFSRALRSSSTGRFRITGGLSNALGVSEWDVRTTGEAVGQRLAGWVARVGVRAVL